jgi:hypothetical protein
LFIEPEAFFRKAKIGDLGLSPPDIEVKVVVGPSTPVGGKGVDVVV